jgi:hypothetical protein
MLNFSIKLDASFNIIWLGLLPILFLKMGDTVVRWKGDSVANFLEPSD